MHTARVCSVQLACALACALVCALVCAVCSWGDFRAKVLGPTDPADAPLDSLRGVIAANWEALGPPSTHLV